MDALTKIQRWSDKESFERDVSMKESQNDGEEEHSSNDEDYDDDHSFNEEEDDGDDDDDDTSDHEHRSALIDDINSLHSNSSRAHSRSSLGNRQSMIRSFMERFGQTISPFSGRSTRELTECIMGLDQYDESELLNNLRRLSEHFSFQSETILTGSEYITACKSILPKLNTILNVFSYNGDILLLACQCLMSLLDHCPELSDEVNATGLIGSICKLINTIEYIDVAEQAILLLEKLANRHSKVILQENALKSALLIMEFFQLRIQRHVLNLTYQLSSSDLDDEAKLQEVVPILKKLLSHSDSIIVQYSCLSLSNIISHSLHEQQSSSQYILESDNIKEIMNMLFKRLNTFSSFTISSIIDLLVTSIKKNPSLALEVLKSNFNMLLLSVLNQHIPCLDDSKPIGNVRISLDNVHKLLDLFILILPSIPEKSLEKFKKLPKQLFNMNPSSFKVTYKNLHEDIGIVEKLCSIIPSLLRFIRNFLNRPCNDKILTIFFQIFIHCKDPLNTLFLQPSNIAWFYSSLCRIIIIYDVKSVILLLEIFQNIIHLKEEGEIFRLFFMRFGLCDLLRKFLHNQAYKFRLLNIKDALKQGDLYHSDAVDSFLESDFEIISQYIKDEATSLLGHFEGIQLIASSSVLNVISLFQTNFESPAFNILYQFLEWFQKEDISGHELYKFGFLNYLVRYLFCPSQNLELLKSRGRDFYALMLNTNYFEILLRLVEKCQCLIRHQERFPIFASSHLKIDSPLSSIKILAKPVWIQFKEIEENENTEKDTLLTVDFNVSSVATLSSLEPYLNRLKASKGNCLNVSSELVNKHLSFSAFNGLSLFLSEAEEYDMNNERNLENLHETESSFEIPTTPDLFIEFYSGAKLLNRHTMIFQIISAMILNSQGSDSHWHHSLINPAVQSLSEYPGESNRDIESSSFNRSNRYTIQFKFTQQQKATNAVDGDDMHKDYAIKNISQLFAEFVNSMKISTWSVKENICDVYVTDLVKSLFYIPLKEPFEASKAYAILLLNYIHFISIVGPYLLQIEELNAETQRSLINATLRRYLINDGLCIKALCQTQGSIALVGRIVPDWLRESLKRFSFFYSFEVKVSYFRGYLLGFARSLTFLQEIYTDESRANQYSENQMLFLDHHHQRLLREEGTDRQIKFGRIKRLKMKISRENISKDARTILIYSMKEGHKESILEVEFIDEVGTGLGPTLEFYSLVTTYLKLKPTALWHESYEHDLIKARDISKENNEDMINDQYGLFLKPRDEHRMEKEEKDKLIKDLQLLGLCITKAVLDKRILDLYCHPVLLQAFLGRPVLSSLVTLASIDKSLAESLKKLQSLSAGELESLDLDFTLPGYVHIELEEHGRLKRVTMDNLEEYIEYILQWFLKDGVSWQIKIIQYEFQERLNMALVENFFDGEEFGLMLSGDRFLYPWTIEELEASIQTDHGYDPFSAPIRYLFEVLSEMNLHERKAFIRFCTGSGSLPIGGLRNLNPRLTVVKRSLESHERSQVRSADEILPSVMTCANYLKLPNYSSKELLKERLAYAMNEGQLAFYMS